VEICLWKDQRLCKQHCWLVCLNTRIWRPPIHLIPNKKISPYENRGTKQYEDVTFWGRYHFVAFVDLEVEKMVPKLEDVATAMLWEGYGLKVRLWWRRAVWLPTDSKWRGRQFEPWQLQQISLQALFRPCLTARA